MTRDVIVIGVGGMGSAACFHLAARGLRVLGIERFDLAHDLGSSHGLTRIIRLAYFEHPSYVPLLRRSFELWRQLETAGQEQILHVTGSIDAGPENGDIFQGSRQSCLEHGLPHEVLDGAAFMRRFPGWRVPSGTKAVFQPDGGFLIPERCIALHAGLARARGAEIRTGERVLEVSPSRKGVAVRTDQGTYEAGQAVLTAGPWIQGLAAPLAPWLRTERQMVGWFSVRDPRQFSPDTFPVFNFECEFGRFYGFPEHGTAGFKIGKYHHRNELVDPDQVDRRCHREDEEALREAVTAYFPSADGPLLQAKACLFTNTPDEHFIVDRHPDAPQILIVSACSGHGFKFASVIGEVVADLIDRGETRHDVSMFRLERFDRR